MNIPNCLRILTNPKQLQKIDRYLLLNYPRFWVTKVHYCIYYGLLVNLILNLFVFLTINPKIIDEFIQYFIVLIMFVEAGIFIFWIVKQSLYNVEKEYGNTSSGIGLLEIIIYTLCAVIITSSSLTMTATAMYRTASLVRMERSTQCSEVISHFQTPYKYEHEVCESMKDFLGGSSNYNYFLPYEIHWFFHTIFLMLGIFLLVIRKYSNWATMGWIGLYVLALIIATIFLGIVLSSLSPNELPWLTILIVLNIVLFFQSTSLTMRRRFDNFQFISFAILPIALGVLISSIVFGSLSNNFRANTIALIMFFVFYIFIFPLYKLILNRTLALPKE
ncbi:MAG: hypothetical protein RPG89_01020 [Microcystis panniformis WG22]|nr:hypothetical protein [Microcystis panniformis WG22]